MNICPVCGEKAIVSHVDNYFEMIVVKCENCDMYYFDDNLFVDKTNYILEPKIKASMYYFMTHNMIQYKRASKYETVPQKYIYFTANIDLDDGYHDVAYKDYYVVSMATLRKIYPINFSDLIDKVLNNLSEYLSYKMGKTFLTKTKFDTSGYIRMTSIYFIAENDEKSAYQEMFACQDKLIEKEYISKVEGDKYTISSKGWERIQGSKDKKGLKDQAFVAMWFSDETNNVRKTLINAIKECNYEPILIDEMQHNKQIVPTLLDEIKKSKFVVAELSGHRGGVYYEAGYAEALGKEVIICCSEYWFNEQRDKNGNIIHDGAHFDIKQKSSVIWDENKINQDELYIDLKEKLILRIKETI